MVLGKEYSAKQVCEIAGVSNASLQNWIKRKLIVGHREIKGGGEGPGRHRRFSFFNVVEIAMASKLIATGLQPKDAFKAAADFAHVGGGGQTFDLPERLPGFPFHFQHGYTIFGISEERTFEVIWMPGSTVDTYGQLRGFLHSDDFITINATKLFDNICSKMGLHPNVVLDNVYPEEVTA